MIRFEISTKTLTLQIAYEISPFGQLVDVAHMKTAKGILSPIDGIY